jgi:hypothetical protein
MRAGRHQGDIPQCLHDSNAMTGSAVRQAIGIVALAIATVTAAGQHPSVSSALTKEIAAAMYAIARPGK